MTSIASIASQDWQTNPTFGDVKYKTLFGSDPQDANAPIAMGYARLEAGQELGLHHHDDAEFYFCTRGSAHDALSMTPCRGSRSGMTIYIPGGSLHGVYAEEDGFEFLYGFPGQADFSSVNYQFVDEKSRSGCLHLR